MSKVLGREACPNCREQGRDKSGDNLIVYEDGGKHCFSCSYHEGNKPYGSDEIGLSEVQYLPHAALRTRGIDAGTAEHFGVRVEYSTSTGDDAKYYYPLYKNREVVGYQVRQIEPKKFKRLGDTKGVDLFGAQLYKGGKMVIVCEGQDDALACYQLLSAAGKKYRVVASLGTTHWKSNLDYLEQYDNVILMFDQDLPGKTAAEECAAALTPGKAKIASWDREKGKDINDLLTGGVKPEDFLHTIFEAKAYEPSGIVTGAEVWERIQNYTKPDYVPYPPEWEDMNRKAEGLRRGEISIWCAGTSIGKTSMIRRIKQHVLTTSKWKIGEVELEERPEKTWRGMMEFQARKPMCEMTQEEKHAAWLATYGTERMYTLEHRSQFSKGADLMSKFKYLHYAKGVDMIALDHVTLGVREFGKEGNEGVDAMMEEFLRFVETTGVHLLLISHLRKSPGGNKSWSRGAVPSEEDMKGCLDATSEYLSPEGWKRMDEYDGGLVAQYDNGQVEYVHPSRYVNVPATQDLYRFHNKTSLDMVVSPDHRMLFTNGEKTAATLVEGGLGRREVVTKFSMPDGMMGMNDSFVELLVACAADACYHGDGLAKAQFKKERKASRFRQLLDDNEVEYSSTVDSKGCTVFRFKALTQNKELHLCHNWYEAHQSELQMLVDSCTFWDGTIAKKDGEEVFYTTKKKEADVVQFASHAVGRVAHIREYKTPQGKPYYHVSIARKGSSKNKVMLRSDSCTVDRVESTDGRQYCFTVPSTYFIARHNNRVFVTGNSGSLYQIAFDVFGVSRNKQHPDEYTQNCSQLSVLKCFSPDTEVLVEGYKTKRVCDLKFDDKLIRPDGTLATIIKFFNGHDKMYHVKQGRGIDYVVSSRHDIVTTEGKFTPDEFINLPYEKRKTARGYKNCLPFDSGDAIRIDNPWLLGMWFGDGDKRDPQITVSRKNDELVEKILSLWADCNVKDKHPTVYRVYMKGFMAVLKQYNLGWQCHNYKVTAKEKVIPEEFINAKYEDKLSFLAGLVDSDGTLNTKNSYRLVTKCPNMADMISRIAMSCGIMANITPTNCKSQTMETTKEYYAVVLRGDVSKLPVVCKHKQVKEYGHDPYVSRLIVSKEGVGEFIGFELEGDPLFLLSDMTVVSNCRETGDTGLADMLYWNKEERSLDIADPTLMKTEEECLDEGLTEDGDF